MLTSLPRAPIRTACAEWLVDENFWIHTRDGGQCWFKPDDAFNTGRPQLHADSPKWTSPATGLTC